VPMFVCCVLIIYVRACSVFVAVSVFIMRVKALIVYGCVHFFIWRVYTSQMNTN
jgi:hypothetical protein